MVRILLIATLSGIPLTESFLRERIHSEKFIHVPKSFVTFYSGRFYIHLQVIQPILKFPYLISLIKPPPPSTSFKIRKSLKRMPSLAYTEMDQTKYRVSSMLSFRCIIYLDIVTRIYMYIIWLANFRQCNYRKRKWYTTQMKYP